MIVISILSYASLGLIALMFAIDSWGEDTTQFIGALLLILFFMGRIGDLIISHINTKCPSGYTSTNVVKTGHSTFHFSQNICYIKD